MTILRAHLIPAALSLALAATITIHACDTQRLTRQIAALQNAAARSDTTHTVAPGVVERAAETSADPAALLAKDAEIDRLTALIAKAPVLTATGLTVSSAPAEGEATARQSDASMGGQVHKVVAFGTSPITTANQDVPRLRVDFTQSFGTATVTGYTLTSPGYAWLRVARAPLRLSVAVTQQSDGTWRTYATSSDPGETITVDASAVNPRILADHWWQRLAVTGTLAVGATSALAGLGVSYCGDGWAVGPSVWVTTGGAAVGVSVAWRPWGR